MKRYGNILKLISVMFTLFLVMIISPAKTMADTEEKDFIYHEKEGDLAVMFTYDGQKPDIVFISPSGKEYAEGVNPAEEFEAAHGEGFSSYRIYAAEVGQWKIRFDRKDNGAIDYSIIEDIDGIVIQSFDILKIDGTTAKVRFEVTKGEEEVVSYKYTISAIAGEDENARKELYSGYADTGVPTELELDMNLSSYGDYRLLLNVVYTDGLEMFDSATTDSFAFRNPNTPDAMEDFWVYVDMEKNFFRVDWQEFAVGYGDIEYNLLAVVDGDKENPIFGGDVAETGVSFYYPKEAKEVEFTLYYKMDGVLSQPVSKKVKLDGGDYLLMDTASVTGDSQVKLSYGASLDTELYAKVNEEEGTYGIKGEDVIMFGLVPGVNNVMASFEGKDRVCYSINEEIYYSTVSPVITFYEDINGHTFMSGEAVIYGKVENAEKLYINDKEVTIDEKGEFTHTVELSNGDNNVVVKATSNTGVSTVKNVFVKNESKVLKGVTNYLPTVIIAVVAVMLMVFSYMFIGKKKEGANKDIWSTVKMATILTGVASVISVGLYIWLRIFNRSSDYLKLVSESVEKASSYLTYETVSFITMIVMLVVFIGLLITYSVKKLLIKSNKMQ